MGARRPSYAELAARLSELRRQPTAREARDLRRAWGRATPEERAAAVGALIEGEAARRRATALQSAEAAALITIHRRDAALDAVPGLIRGGDGVAGVRRPAMTPCTPGAAPAR
jgi:hypothetical protein